MTNEKLIKMLQDGYTIETSIVATKFNSSVHFYLVKKLKETFENKTMHVMKKDGHYILICESD